MLLRGICNGKRPRPVKLPELAFRLGQPVGDRPQCRRLTPSPTWLARCTSIFSAVSEGRSRQVRQFTIPSVRE